MSPQTYSCLTEKVFFVFTDEINLPADIPSYLSSQGTLSEPQEGYSNSEAGSHQQLMPPLSNGYVHKNTDGESSPFLNEFVHMIRHRLYCNAFTSEIFVAISLKEW